MLLPVVILISQARHEDDRSLLATRLMKKGPRYLLGRRLALGHTISVQEREEIVGDSFPQRGTMGAHVRCSATLAADSYD